MDNWAGKPKEGLHLDVTKEGILVQRLMVDKKTCYFFGRRPDLSDFTIDHVSCSRLHAALTYHKHLNHVYLTDLGSTHGTFVENTKLEANKSTIIRNGTYFHFGAFNRRYTLREKFESDSNMIGDEVEQSVDMLTVSSNIKSIGPA